MYIKQSSILTISLVLFLNLFVVNGLLAKVAYPINEVTTSKLFAPKEKIVPKKIKGKKERAIAMLVGGIALIFLSLVLIALTIFLAGRAAMLVTAIGAVFTLAGGIILVIKGYNDLTRGSKRAKEDDKSTNKGKATY